MRIKNTTRTVFNKHQIKQVVCQIAFPTNLALQEAPVKLQNALADDYPVLEIQPMPAMLISIAGGEPISQSLPVNNIAYNFSSEDKNWKITVTQESFTLACTAYEDWEKFQPRLQNCYERFLEIYPTKTWKRIGLRYINTINKDILGLADVSWAKLIKPFALGIFSSQGLFEKDEVDESKINTVGTFAQIELESCKLIFRSHFEKTDPQSSLSQFSIDGDFYVDETATISRSATGFIEVANNLHTDAGNLFRSCLEQPLWDALEPA